jgi:hypothetical protein
MSTGPVGRRGGFDWMNDGFAECPIRRLSLRACVSIIPTSLHGRQGRLRATLGSSRLANLSSSWQTIPVHVEMIWLRFFESPRSIE